MTRQWNAKRPAVPVDKDGNWEHYAAYYHGAWEEIVQPFPATVTIDGTFSGRSAKYLILRNKETGVTYPMFVSDLARMIQTGAVEIKDGEISGWWTASKKGSNYGIKAVVVDV